MNASIFVQILLVNYHKEYKKISMDNVSLLAEDSHGKKKLGERREISAGLRRVLSFSTDHICGRNLLGQLLNGV